MLANLENVRYRAGFDRYVANGKIQTLLERRASFTGSFRRGR
jgi:hypothetical protein